MWSHLKTNHPNEYSISESKRAKFNNATTSCITATPKIGKRQTNQPMITTAFTLNTPYSRDSTKWKRVTEKLTTMLAKLMLPFSLVDEPEFKDFVSELDSRYVAPGRKYISEVAIPARYNDMKANVIANLKEASHVSLTTDGWSSSTQDSFLSLTVHYITPSWGLQSWCLRTIYMPESHSGENIAYMIRNILREYGLTLDKITSITTDNATSMIKAGQELNVIRIPCFGHILHNSIKNSTKQPRVEETLQSVRAIVTTFSHSGKLKIGLKKEQKDRKLDQKGLVGECSTRWGSKYKMLERMYVNREAVQTLLMSDRKWAKHTPTWNNLVFMETFLHTLKPYSTLTDMLSNSRTVSISNIMPMLKHIEEVSGEEIQIDVPNDCKEISKEIRSKIWEYVDKKYKEADNIPGHQQKLFSLLNVCRYLDPRLAEPDQETTEAVVMEMVALELVECGEEEASAEEVVEDEGASGDFTLMDILMRATSGNEPSMAEEDANTRARKELAYYLQVARTMIAKSGDLMEWWKSKGDQFPMVQRVARKYLNCNATSTASERLFSFAGMVVSKKRNSLKPEKVDMLSCLAYNLRALKM